MSQCVIFQNNHNDVIKWKHFPRYWPFVQGIHRPPVNSPHKGQWRGALMFSLIYTRINGWVNNDEAGDLRRHRAHYDVTVMRIYLLSVYLNIVVPAIMTMFNILIFAVPVNNSYPNYIIVKFPTELPPPSMWFLREIIQYSLIDASLHWSLGSITKRWLNKTYLAAPITASV